MKFQATYERHNPQLSKSYTTTRIIEACNKKKATSIAEKKAKNCLYGSMYLISVEEVI